MKRLEEKWQVKVGTRVRILSNIFVMFFFILRSEGPVFVFFSFRRKRKKKEALKAATHVRAHYTLISVNIH